jgi:outer membrane protein assembly factor BamB
VTWATHVDLKTGRPVETAEARYGKKAVRLAPSPLGAHHWPPMAFNPATGLVYFPGQDTSGVFQSVEAFNFKPGQWNTGTRMGATAADVAANPAPIPGIRSFLLAWDPVAQKERWRNEFRPSGGVLSTAGNLIFVGDAGGKLHAFDPASGRSLWQGDVLPGVATPVTYSIDGKQYVAVLAGSAKGRVFTFALSN